MDMDQVMIVAGIGCRKGASADQIAAAIASALAGTACKAFDIIAAAAAKGDEPGIAAAAQALGVTLVLVQQNELEAAGSRTLTHSERVMALMGVPSVAEAAALAAAGPSARLLAARIALGPVTCALAQSENAP
jgi:cobalt-precorrin 5A hydrolase